MKVVYPRCAGINIHQSSMTVCIWIDRGNGSEPQYEKRKLPTHSGGIQELASRLERRQVTMWE